MKYHGLLRERIFAAIERIENDNVSDAGTSLSFALIDSLKNLEREVEGVKSDQSKLFERLEVNTGIIELELKYGVNITYGESEITSIVDMLFPPLPAEWSRDDVKDIEAVLSSIPEHHLLLSPLLREIQRVGFLGSGVLGARYPDGTIKIANLAVNHDGMSAAYKGTSSLKIILAHEIGHAIQLGAGPGWFNEDEAGADAFQGGEERYDFDEFLRLSGWEVIDDSRWEINEDWTGIILDGEDVPIYEPFSHNGQEIVLTFHPAGVKGILLSYKADSNFSFRDYSRETPWEDFAECFAEYLFLPERLIELAPEKFKHLEEEFRRYHNNTKIQELLLERS